MSRPDSIEDEPHFRDADFKPDPSEERAARNLKSGPPVTENEAVDHAVWDEPAHSPELTGGAPAGSLTYRSWFLRRRDETTAAKSWGTALALAYAAGPWAIFGALWGSGQTAIGFLAVALFGPIVEEVMKTALTLWVIEKRPFLFRSRLQIAVCALGAGLCFGAIENVMYLNVYIPNPPPGLVAWRWTVCTALHAGCTFIAGLGLMRIWKDAVDRLAPPRLSLGSPHLAAAAAIHGAYNAGAVLLQMSNFQF